MNITGYLWEIVKHRNSGSPKQRLDGPLGMSEIDYQAFLTGVESGKISEKDGIVGVYRWLRDHTLNGTKDAGRTFHDLALDLGRPGLGGFAPVGRNEPLQRRAAPRPQGSSNGATLPKPRQSGQRSSSVAPVGEAENAAPVTSYKAILAQAKALAAQQQQNRQAASDGMYLAPSGKGLEGVSFAPIGARSLGPAARFAAHTEPSAATAETLMPTQTHFGDERFDPRRPPDQTAILAAGAQARGHAASDASTALTAPTALTGSQAHFGRMLDDYVFQQSRLPPRGGAAFNPLISPLWAGLKIPG